LNHNFTSYNIHSVDFFSSTKFKIFVILGTTLNPGESFLILMKKRKRKERSNNVYDKWQEIEGLNQKPWRVKNEKSICRFSKKNFLLCNNWTETRSNVKLDSY
jgi:uncharacterized SAM-dependent methyltransferase